MEQRMGMRLEHPWSLPAWPSVEPQKSNGWCAALLPQQATLPQSSEAA